MGADRTNFMDFEALRREPDKSVKIIYQVESKQRESRESDREKHEVAGRNLCRAGPKSSSCVAEENISFLFFF